jgi:hypothetical protein
MQEMYDTRIEYKPVISGSDTCQDFKVHDISYRVLAKFVPNIHDMSNVLHVEFMNIDKDSFDITKDCYSPAKVFGIIFNWVDDYLMNADGRIDHIVIATTNNNDDKYFGKRSRLYATFVKKFLDNHPEYFRDDAMEGKYESFKDIVLFIVTKGKSS